MAGPRAVRWRTAAACFAALLVLCVFLVVSGVADGNAPWLAVAGAIVAGAGLALAIARRDATPAPRLRRFQAGLLVAGVVVLLAAAAAAAFHPFAGGAVLTVALLPLWAWATLSRVTRHVDGAAAAVRGIDALLGPRGATGNPRRGRHRARRP